MNTPLPTMEACTATAAEPVRIAGPGDPAFRLAGYPGAKGAEGVWQRIISEIPACQTFIEAFAGSATITRAMRPAPCSILIDADPVVCRALEMTLPPGAQVICANALTWLQTQAWSGFEVVYCDPPYLASVRGRPGRRYYCHELDKEEEHDALLGILKRLPIPVLLSGYRSALYDALLADWRRIDYSAATRGGAVVESLWLNFAPPLSLHDTRFVGGNFRERERIKRKKARWARRLAAMPSWERQAVLEAIQGQEAV